jgi:autoinducer 2-degrading protein
MLFWAFCEKSQENIMYVVCVTVKVKPEFTDAFIQASELNHRGTTTTEPGNLRWDFLQAEDDPARFFIYEVYRTKDDFAAHQQTEHYKTWRATVADWMSEPRSAVKHFNVFPDDAHWTDPK